MLQTITPHPHVTDGHTGLFPTQRPVALTAVTSTQSASRLAARPLQRVRTHATQGVVVLEATGRLSDVAESW